MPVLIARPRVEARLRDTVESAALTLVQAPLGAGKSIALAAALRGHHALAWIDARPWDRGAFANAIVEAVRSVRPDFGRMTLGAIAASADAAHVGATFAEDLTHVDEPLTIVVDDVQAFSDDAAFGRFAEAAVEGVPGNVRIVLAGRSMPDIPLGASVARGRAAIFDGALLAFDVDEICALSRLRERSVDRPSAERIIRATEGWAAGVTLALEARSMLVPTPAGPRSAAAAYLAEELLPTLPAQLLAFLEDTAVFEVLDLRVLAHSDAFSGAEGRIAELRKRGALVTDLGGERYRVHPILRELAHNGLRGRGALRSAHAAAAAAFADAGEAAAALFHAEAARNPRLAATFLREHTDAAIATGDHSRIKAIAALIDPAGADADVRWYVDGLLEKAGGSGDIRTQFARAAQAADASGDRVIAFRARVQVVEHDLGRLRAVDDGTLADLARRASELGSGSAPAAAVLHGWAAALRGDFREALNNVRDLSPDDADAARFNVAILRAYAHTALGESDAAEETLEELVRSLELGDAVVLQTLALVWFARLALLWGRTNEAADAAAQAERLSGALTLRAEEAALYVALAEIATHRGDARAAVRFAERARGVAERAWYVADVERVRAFAEIALARAAFIAGDYAVARELASRLAAKADIPTPQKAIAATEGAIYTLLCDPLTAAEPIGRARTIVAAAVPVDASDAVGLAVADDLLAFLDLANGQPHDGRLPACEPFGALVVQRRGLVTLEHAGIAVGNARRGTGSALPFETALELLTREGPRFEARLAQAYTAHFLRPARAMPVPPSFEADLTPREFEILSLLVDGLTNKEIAQRLIVSPRTVETHVERVLGKLDVGSRSRAIAKAIRLGLVAVT